MSNIIKMHSLPDGGNDYIDRATKQQIKDKEDTVVIAEIVGIISAAYSIMGSVGNATDYELMAEELYCKIIASFPYVTTEEIRHAVMQGAYGGYGEFFGINPRSIFGFVECYVKSSERKLAIDRLKIISMPKLLSSPGMTAEEWEKAINEDYRLYKEGNWKIIVIMDGKYQYLIDTGCMKISEQSFHRWLMKAKDALYDIDVHRAKLRKDSAEVKKITEIIEHFSESGEMPEDYARRIEVQAKKMIYLKFFSKMFEQQEETIF